MKDIKPFFGVLRKAKATHWVYILLNLLLLVLGFLLVTARNATIVAVGSSLIATGMAGIVLFLHAWLSQGDLQRLAIMREFGLLEAFSSRGVPIKARYDERLRVARERIDIMGFGLRALREDYHAAFGDWATRASVRILLLDPEFFDQKHSLAVQRDQEENEKSGKIEEDVRAFARACAPLLHRSRSRFQIRLFRCLPSVNIFRIDNEMFWGPYLIGDVSRNCPTLLIDRGGTAFKSFTDHFERIWSSDKFSRSIPSEWVDSDAAESGR